MTKRLLLILPVILSLFLSGCFDGDTQTTSTDGEELYSLYCDSCHKSDGSGNFLKGIPANKLTDLYQDQLILLIRYGDPSLPEMPKFPHLSEVQATAIAKHLYSLKR